MKNDYKKMFVAFTPIVAGAVGYGVYQETVRKRRISAIRLNLMENIPKLQNVLILGDSVARGCGSSNGGFGSILISLIEERTGRKAQLTNLGVDGLTSGGLVNILKAEETKDSIARADLIVLNIGGNDLLELFTSGGPHKVIKEFRETRKTFKKNLLYIKETIRTINPNAALIANGLYNPCEKEYAYYSVAGQLIKSWNKTYRCSNSIFVDTFGLSREGIYWADEVHPSEEGYKILADLIFKQAVDCS
ncbi:SGNH/GDSL hydrolase family protein [Priestia sp. SB1]|uniref:SGNH/GDSL hydrolase family protein n=1 Tax=Priestia sp. SB1 TaxID=3132359 RepID=UPI001D343DEF|nr:hypothetical protein [Priestia megaterium]